MDPLRESPFPLTNSVYRLQAALIWWPYFILGSSILSFLLLHKPSGLNRTSAPFSTSIGQKASVGVPRLKSRCQWPHSFPRALCRLWSLPSRLFRLSSLPGLWSLPPSISQPAKMSGVFLTSHHPDSLFLCFLLLFGTPVIILTPLG